jgi:hypothetical protein
MLVLVLIVDCCSEEGKKKKKKKDQWTCSLFLLFQQSGSDILLSFLPSEKTKSSLSLVIMAEAFVGTWVLDTGKSDSFDDLLTAQGVGFIKRKVLLLLLLLLLFVNSSHSRLAQ